MGLLSNFSTDHRESHAECHLRPYGLRRYKEPCSASGLSSLTKVAGHMCWHLHRIRNRIVEPTFVLPVLKSIEKNRLSSERGVSPGSSYTRCREDRGVDKREVDRDKIGCWQNRSLHCQAQQ